MGLKSLRNLIWLSGLLLLAACQSAPTTVQPTQTPTVPDCVVVVPDFSAGFGMITAYNRLGIWDYANTTEKVVVNGAVETKRYTPQPNDVIVLENKPAQCNGEYIAARRSTFNFQTGTSRDLSGFQSSVTESRILNALEQVCEGVRWEQFGLRFDGDIVNGGCNFATAVKLSYTDGSSSCATYATVNEAYESTQSNLESVKWVSVYSVGEAMSDTTDYCELK